MYPYKLKYHKNSVLLIAMVGIPVLFISLMLYCLFSLPSSLSETSTLLFVSLSIILMALFLLWITKTQIFVLSKISISEKGISFKLRKTSFLYRRTDFFSEWENVTSVIEMFDNHNGGYFYQITFKNPAFVANFSALKNHETAAERFFSELKYYQESYNIAHQLPLSRKLNPSNSFS
ncbi:hypothetical protein [Pedobacter sp.]|uniref:hypothetical protein n=1 Tax=Pedobacter sp. TaxID=1411316 RepID=UPI0031D9AB0E